MEEAQGIQIVVVDRGFVYIGRTSIEGDWCYLSQAQNIRRWGTSRGLGELVQGPTEKTKLDPVGNVKIPLKSLISLIAVEGAAWEPHLK